VQGKQKIEGRTRKVRDKNRKKKEKHVRVRIHALVQRKVRTIPEVYV
jgi:hypothetical protein